MKEKSGSRIGRVAKRIFNVRTWFDWERTKSFSAFVGNGFKRVFMSEVEEAKESKNALTESFNAAKKQFNLTDADLLARQRSLLFLTALMATIALLIFGYAIYHFFYGTILAGMISLVVMLIAVALAFRYHFWYFQIKNHKLGCTLKEWFRKGLLGEKE